MTSAHGDKPSGELPTVRVGIGMSFRELKEGSTYPFSASPSIDIGKDFSAFEIATPYNLVLVDGVAELKLDHIGGERELTSIIVSDDRVSDLSITVHNGRANLHQTIQQAHTIHRWFLKNGYLNDGYPDFVVKARNSKQPMAPITDFEQAEAAFLSPTIKLSEMGLFGLRKGDVGVGVSLDNGRRMRAKYNKQYDDESSAAEERTYSLMMGITGTVKPYKADGR